MAHAMPVRAHVCARAEPTSLLLHLAGALAPKIAAHWPAPHDGFLAMPTGRRHAAAMLISRGDLLGAGFASWIANARDGEVMQRVEPKTGKRFMTKLARMGEQLWTAEEYAALSALLAEDATRKVLGHLKVITPVAIQVCAELPVAFRVPGIVCKLTHVEQARRLADGHDLAVHRLKQVRARDLAERLSRAENVEALGRMAADAIQPQRFGRPGLPPELPAPFRLITNRATLERTAIAFENCLRDFVDRIARGLMAVYTWEGQPRVVLALAWDPAGWRLAEAEIKANDDVPEPVLRGIVDVIEAYEVRTGSSLEEVGRRLCGLEHAAQRQVDPRGNFHDRLDLGELWD